MDKIYEELEEIKAEAEKLRRECRAKTELSDCLRKSHMEQQSKIQEMKLETEKLAQELNSKSEEICEIRQLYEEIQSSLKRKELLVQQISSANEKLRTEYGEKIQNLEGENRGLVLALDEASARIEDLEKKTSANDEEIAGLKRVLSGKPEKSFERGRKASKDLEKRDEYILRLEEDNRINQEKMKWKNEQFSHLEEAHRKLQTQFQVSKEEWDKEKSALIDEISSLQANLDSQIRISESLESQIRMCDQALAHEQSRRKILEIEVSEYRSRYENVFQECQLAKSEMVELTMKRDEEIAEIRNSLRKKEVLSNEMKYRNAQLEQENSDLLESLKDIQEAEINSSFTSSSKKLRERLRDLEHLHSKCAAKLKEKEADLYSEIEKLKRDLEHCLFDLDGKNKSIGETRKELEDCRCQLEVKNEEMFMLMLVLKSEFYVAYSKLCDAKENSDMVIKEIEEKNMLLEQELEIKDTEIHKVHAQLKQKCDAIAVLTEQVQSFDSFQQKNILMGEELKMCKEMLDESNECHLRLRQQSLELENTKRQNRKDACDALQKVNFQLANKTSEVEKYKLELENLKLRLQENQQALIQENANLLVMSKNQEFEIGKLKEQIHMLESVILEKLEAAEMLKQENNSYRQIAEDRNCSIGSLQSELAQLKKELAEKDTENIALSDACLALKQENERVLSNIKERDQKLQELQKEIESLDENLKNAEISFAEKEIIFIESLKRATDQKILEIEEKNKIVANLEKELNGLREENELKEKTLVQSKKDFLQLEDSLRAKNSEMELLTSQFEKKRKCSECLIEELESHKKSFLEDLKKSSIDREDLLAQLEGISGQMGLFYRDNVELMGILEKILHLSVEDDATFSPSRKLVQVTTDDRTPLTELNC